MLVLKFGILAYLIIAVSSSFGGSDEKFLKKYAMMKIYESCFGAEVVKQIRKEMKLACLKCASYETPPPAPQPPQPSTLPPRPFATNPPKMDGGISDQDNIIYANAQAYDVDKLNPGIIAYKPNFQNPYPLPPAFRPYSNPAFYSGYPGQGPMLFQPPFQQSYGFSPYNVPFLGGQYFGNQRTARDMDFRGQLESITSKMSGRVKNVTCVMQELGYLDDKLEPNFYKIRERIRNLPISKELKDDMEDGVTFCQQFSKCVPEVRGESTPLSSEFVRPMFFFKCYKHKKLEACIMKDIREKYPGVEDEFDSSEMELRRTGKAMKMPKEDTDLLASSMYEFLYGSNSNAEVDNFF